MRCSGPDNDRDAVSDLNHDPSVQDFVDHLYDPTNGTVSTGDIWRAGDEPICRGSDSVRLISQ